MLHFLRAAGALLLFLPRRAAALPVVLWTALIAWLGSWSSVGVGALGASALLTNLAHAPLFGLLALWFALALPRVGAGGGGWPRLGGADRGRVLAAVALWALADEVHQLVLNRGRDFSLLDIATDLVGAACVLAVIDYLGRDAAGERGLLGRLALGGAACLAAAASATWVPLLFPGAAWL